MDNNASNTLKLRAKGATLDALSHVSREYLPSLGTQSYKVLAVLADGLEHGRDELCLALSGADPRSALQALRGQAHGFWRIPNLGISKGLYRLDSRHLEQDHQKDEVARLEAELELSGRSLNQAERETSRLPIALASEEAARARVQMSLELEPQL